MGPGRAGAKEKQRRQTFLFPTFLLCACPELVLANGIIYRVSMSNLKEQNKTNENKCRVLFSLQGGAVEWAGDGEAAARLRRYLPSHPDLVLESVREKRSISLCPLG